MALQCLVLGLCMHNDGEVWVPHIYGTSTRRFVKGHLSSVGGGNADSLAFVIFENYF